MQEGLTLKELIIYLFRIKRWSGGNTIWDAWFDILRDIDLQFVRNAIEQAIETTIHIDGTTIYKWAIKYKKDHEKYERIARGKQKKYISFTGFCYWCLETREWDTTYGDMYCAVCNAKWNAEKSNKAKELYIAKELEYVKKCREVILNKFADFNALQKYKELMKAYKAKSENYQYVI